MFPRPPGISVCTPAVTWKPCVCTSRSPGGPAYAPQSHLEFPNVHLQGHQGALCVHPLRSSGTQVCAPTDRLTRACIPRGPGTAALPGAEAQPSSLLPGISVPSSRGRRSCRGGLLGGPEPACPPLPPAVPGQVQRLQQPRAPCPCRLMLLRLPHVSESAGPWWVLRWPSRSSGRCLPAKDAGGEGSTRRSLGPSDLTMVGTKPPCAFYTSAP